MQKKKKKNSNTITIRSMRKLKKISLAAYYVWLLSNSSQSGNTNLKLRVILLHGFFNQLSMLFVNTNNYFFNQLSAIVTNKHC